MPIYYFEGSPILAPLTIASNEPVYGVDSLDLSHQRVSYGAQRWELSFRVAQAGGEENLFAGLVTSRAETKTMIMPQLVSVDRKAPSISISQGITTSSVSAGANSLQATVSESGVLIPRGSFISFSNHNKIYMLVSPITTNSSVVTFNVYPSLLKDVPASTAIYHPYSSIKPVLSYLQNTETLQGITYSDGILVDIGTISIFEGL
jgi:hypothetical protein